MVIFMFNFYLLIFYRFHSRWHPFDWIKERQENFLGAQSDAGVLWYSREAAYSATVQIVIGYLAFVPDVVEVVGAYPVCQYITYESVLGARLPRICVIFVIFVYICQKEVILPDAGHVLGQLD